MHRPVLVTAPATTPISLEEAKAHLRVNVEDEEGNLLETEDDELIQGLIKAATDHLDGWTGILGRCLVEQEWRQDFDRFDRYLALPLGPVIEVVSVTWRNRAGQIATVDSEEYALQTDAGGRGYIRFRDAFSLPGDLYQTSAVSVTYKAGYPIEDSVVTVPQAIKQAILLLVGAWYDNREQAVIGTITATLPASVAVDALLAPYREHRI